MVEAVGPRRVRPVVLRGPPRPGRRAAERGRRVQPAGPRPLAGLRHPTVRRAGPAPPVARPGLARQGPARAAPPVARRAGPAPPGARAGTSTAPWPRIRGRARRPARPPAGTPGRPGPAGTAALRPPAVPV